MGCRVKIDGDKSHLSVMLAHVSNVCLTVQIVCYHQCLEVTVTVTGTVTGLYSNSATWLR